MTAKLATRIAVLPHEERAPGSRDVLVFHEPQVGALVRTKGSLFILVQVSGTDAALARAARQAAEWVEQEYYYDLSAGVLGSLAKALRLANRRLYHGRARFGIPRRGGVSMIAAAIQGREAHVVRLGPAAGVILRAGRMYEIPPPPPVAEEDPRVRARRVAATLGEALEIEPYAWRGEVAPGDRLALLSRNLARVVGVDALKRALAFGRPSTAVEHLHQLFNMRGGTGSDGVLLVEIMELPATVPTRRLEPVYPEEPLAGLPDRSPVPLADALGSVLHRAAHAARALRASAGRGGVRAFGWMLAFVPRRRVAYPRRISRTSVREAGRRRRIGLAGMVVLASLVALGAMVGNVGGPSPTEAIQRTEVARAAIASAQQLLTTVETQVEGATLVDRDPEEARELLGEASAAIARARDAGVDAERLDRLQARVDGGLDRLYGVTRLHDVAVVSDVTGTRMVDAADGSLWVVDAVGDLVRSDPGDGSPELVLRAGQEAEGGVPDEPWLMTTAATDVVVIDRQRQAWRIDLAERLPRRMTLNGAERIADGTTLLGSVQHRPPLEIFTLYLVDAAGGAIWKWTPPAVIPVEFPDPPVSFLSEAPDLPAAAARDIRVDANLWLLHADTLTRVNFGRPLPQEEYSLDRPPDARLRPRLDYRLFDAATVGDRELFYVYDRANARVIGFNRADGAFVHQWLAPAGGPHSGILDRVIGLTVAAVGEGPPTAFLLTPDGLLRVVLE